MSALWQRSLWLQLPLLQGVRAELGLLSAGMGEISGQLAPWQDIRDCGSWRKERWGMMQGQIMQLWVGGDNEEANVCLPILDADG